MTCIVAIAEKGTVYMGGDSAASSGWDVTMLADPKIFVNGDYLIGSCGSIRMRGLLHHKLAPPLPTGDLARFMNTTFIDEVRALFRDNGFSKKENNVESGGLFLVGIQGKIFQIHEDYQVLQSQESYMSVGCGWTYALGSLATSQGAPQARLRKALEVSVKFSNGVRPPFRMVKKDWRLKI